MKLNLREIRKNKKMTQDALAEAVGATPRQIGAWERGENDIPMDFALSIAEVLQCSIDDIAGRDSRHLNASLSIEERDLIDDYRRATKEGKRAIEATARAMARL